MGFWLVGGCQEARIEVDDKGVREGASGVDGGVVRRLIVTADELGEPVVCAVLEAMVTVRLPVAPVAVVGTDSVSESEAEKVRVPFVSVPWEPDQE